MAGDATLSQWLSEVAGWLVRCPLPEGVQYAGDAMNASLDARRLEVFIQWVADHSNQPSIVREARRHGAR